jgi:hypothetical protein
VIRFLSILAIIALAYPGMYNFSLVLDYQLDMEKYISNCENLDVPMMHCDGKCLLAKKIKAANEEHRPDVPNFITEFSNYLAPSSIEMTQFERLHVLKWFFRDVELLSASQEILRPPTHFS